MSLEGETRIAYRYVSLCLDNSMHQISWNKTNTDSRCQYLSVSLDVAVLDPPPTYEDASGPKVLQGPATPSMASMASMASVARVASIR